jgi:hypothetical protein
MSSRSSLSPSARLAYDETKQSIRDYEQAKSAVKPFVGEMNDSEFEDADDIYEYAFERAGIDPEDYKDVDGSAYHYSCDFWLRNGLISESMGHHDSEMVNGGCID